jgi:glycosyltransferase involved in cell wall biosynthesis
VRVIVSHPGTGPFVRQTVCAFHEAGLLEAFHTSLAFGSGSLLSRIALSAGNSGHLASIANKLNQRIVADVPANLLKAHPFGEVCRLVAGRFANATLLDTVWEWAETGFDRGVAKHVAAPADAVYTYEHAALATLQAARKTGLLTIYEMPAPHHALTSRVFSGEYERFPELFDSVAKELTKRARRRDERRDEELRLADVIVCNSRLTQQSLLDAGVDSQRIVRVPLGMPPVSAAPKRPEEGSKQIFLHAGTMSVRKGTHYLLRAWRRVRPPRTAELRLFGKFDLPVSTVKNLPDNVHISGTISQNQLKRWYQRSALLLFPTLLDGFGMVLTEAMAAGLPVLTTRRAGSSDFIEHGRNGFLIPPADDEAIAESLDWCFTHPAELAEMRQHCLRRAASWQWSDYRECLRNELLGAKDKLARAH